MCSWSSTTAKPRSRQPRPSCQLASHPTVDLVGTARLVDALQPLVVPGTAMVCLASMTAQIMLPTGDPAGNAVIDAPLDERILDRLHVAVGAPIEDSALAYA